LIGVPGGTWSLRVDPIDGATRVGDSIVLSDGASIEKNMTVEPGVSIHGRVFDGCTGAAIRGALVQDGLRQEFRATHTNVDGRFILKGLSARPGGSISVCAQAHGFAEAERTVQVAERDEADVEFALTSGRTVQGRLLGPDGEFLRDVFVAALAPNKAGQWIGERRFARTNADGTFRFDDLSPGSRHALFIRSTGYGTKLFELPESETESNTVDVGEIRLDRGSTLLGRIIDETARPVADIIVNLDGCNADRSQFSASALTGLDRVLAHQEARTDDQGRFGFTDVSRGSYRVTASVKGSATSTYLDLSMGSNEVVENQVLELFVGEVIEGRLMDPDGQPLVAYAVDAYSDAEPTQRATYNLTRGDGSFHLQGLQPGTYTLVVDPWWSVRLDSSVKRYPSSTWRAIRAGTRDLQLHLSRPASISGMVVDASGVPVASASVQATYCGEAPHAGIADAFAHTDQQGRFHLDVKESSCLDVEAYVADSSGQRVDQVATLTGVAAGTTDLVLRLHKFP
jgi:protocatechuate 3,4-dioxygenase beta subunit